MTKAIKPTWKRDYGDGEETDDVVLWYKGKPLDIVISGATSGECGGLFLGNREVYIADTRKELKWFFDTDEECQRFFKEQIKGL